MTDPKPDLRPPADVIDLLDEINRQEPALKHFDNYKMFSWLGMGVGVAVFFGHDFLGATSRGLGLFFFIGSLIWYLEMLQKKKAADVKIEAIRVRLNKRGWDYRHYLFRLP